MNEILISAEKTERVLEQIQQVLGGEIKEKWGEYILTVSNNQAQGTIRCIIFDWGVSLFEFDLIFHEETVFVTDNSLFNPIQFVYSLQGNTGHRFGHQDAITMMEQFQSVIISGKDGGTSFRLFPSEVKVELNIIHITRKLFLRKRFTNRQNLNNQLYNVFHDTDHENHFAYYGRYNLKLADKIIALRNSIRKDVLRILKIEGLVYQILSLHIIEHDKSLKTTKKPANLLKKELKGIRNLSKKMADNISKEYSLKELAFESGISQSKLQEGFKFLYARTVTEYIRHVRLIQARDLLVNTELNISEVVYSVGFSSRSYFSKIFKEKFEISPNVLKKNKKAHESV